MPATIVDYQATDWTDTTASGVDEVTASVSWNAGDWIVVVGATEDSAVTIATPTATGLTFELLSSTSGASNCNTYVWAARATSASSGAITADTSSGAGNYSKGIAALVVRDSSGIGKIATLTGSTAKTITLQTTATDSAVVCILADYAAVNDTAVDPTPSTNGTVRTATNASTRFTGFVVSWEAQGAPASTAYGITNHTGTVDMSGIAIELRSAPASYYGAGTVGSGGTTSVSVPYPAIVQAGDLLVAVVGNRPNANTPDNISGWTKVSATGGAGSEGAGTGTIRGTLFYKIASGSESGNLTVACTSGTSMFGRMFRLTCISPYAWDVRTESGSDNSAGTSWSATAANDPGIAGNDILLCCSINSEDTARAASEAVSATGVTFATMTELQDSGITTGNDLGMIVSLHPATAGPSSAAPVFTMTMSGTNAANSAGVTWFVRVRADWPYPALISQAAKRAAFF